MKKLQKVISMVLVFVLILCMCPFAAAEDTSSDVESGAGFHAPTIRRMIEVNLACGNADEEFFHLLANAYLADPELLIATIVDLPEDDIGYLAKAIAYDLQKTQRQDAVRTDFADPAAEVVGRLIALETADTENASLDVFLGEDMLTDAVTGEMPDAELLANDELTGITLSLSTNATDVASIVTATISFRATVTSTAIRSYRIKLYKRVGASKLVCGTGLASISPNSTTASASINVAFNATGVYTVFAEICNPAGNLVGTSPDASITVTGKWQIDVVLPSDRDYKGTLTLYDASGTMLLNVECLGRSESNADPSIYKGNTPEGECEGWLVGPVEQSLHDSYGPYKFINLNPISGDIKDYYWRSEFMIHGGAPETNSSLARYPLRPTHGCIRISNYHQNLMQIMITTLIEEECHYTVGMVSITQVE